MESHLKWFFYMSDASEMGSPARPTNTLLLWHHSILNLSQIAFHTDPLCSCVFSIVLPKIYCPFQSLFALSHSVYWLRTCSIIHFWFNAYNNWTINHHLHQQGCELQHFMIKVGILCAFWLGSARKMGQIPVQCNIHVGLTVFKV